MNPLTFADDAGVQIPRTYFSKIRPLIANSRQILAPKPRPLLLLLGKYDAGKAETHTLFTR